MPGLTLNDFDAEAVLWKPLLVTVYDPVPDTTIFKVPFFFHFFLPARTEAKGLASDAVQTVGLAPAALLHDTVTQPGTASAKPRHLRLRALNTPRTPLAENHRTQTTQPSAD